MLKNYFLVSFRNLTKNKLFSIINILGLAISMAIGLFSISFLLDINRYDTFHEHYHNIYRVRANTFQAPYIFRRYASLPVRAAEEIEIKVPGIKNTLLLSKSFSPILQKNDEYIPLNGLYAGANFFDIFSFQLLEGEPKSALSTPNSVVLTEGLAMTLLGKNENVVNEIIRTTDGVTYKVTGLVRDVPKSSHMKFEALCSFTTLAKARGADANFNRWDHITNSYLYIQLQEEQSPETILQQLEIIAENANAELGGLELSFELQKLSEIVPGQDLSNEIGIDIEPAMPLTIAVLSIIIIISACFNYTNLSIARTLNRSKEIGMRKVMGANVGSVFLQLIFEAILISFFALIFASLLFESTKSIFLSFNNDIQQIASLDSSLELYIYFMAFALITGILAGISPSLIFARINALNALKNVSSIKVMKRLNLRKLLIIGQFAMSMIFIIGAYIGNRQYTNAIDYDLGFETDNIINIDLQGNDPNLILAELQKIPEVADYSLSSVALGTGNVDRTFLQFANGIDSLEVFYNAIDDRYLQNHNHKLLAGTNFSTSTNKVEGEVIVNQYLLGQLNIISPSEAIGQLITIDHQTLRIIGVIEDFHYLIISDPVEAFVFRRIPDRYQYVNLKTNSSDILPLMEKIEKHWLSIDPVQNLEANVLNDNIKEAYSGFRSLQIMMSFLGSVAIIIALIGFLGIAVYSTQIRMKEIGVRKVLGATEKGLVFLLFKNSLKMILIAGFVALPATYFLFKSVILGDFIYSAPITLLELLSGVILMIFLSFLTVAPQTFRATRSNPVTILRNE